MQNIELFLILYAKARNICYTDYMQGAKLLAEWCRPFEAYPEWENDVSADICSSCGYIFAERAFGGRLRKGCYKCKNAAAAISEYELQQLSHITNLSMPAIEYLLSDLGESFALFTRPIAISKDSVSHLQHSSSSLRPQI
jgi:hypothetical protein